VIPYPLEAPQIYLQRYMQHFPAAGETVIFDRSWYNRAGVEYAWALKKGEHSGSDIYSNRAGCPVTAKTAFHLRPSGSICFF